MLFNLYLRVMDLQCFLIHNSIVLYAFDASTTNDWCLDEYISTNAFRILQRPE